MANEIYIIGSVYEIQRGPFGLRRDLFAAGGRNHSPQRIPANADGDGGLAAIIILQVMPAARLVYHTYQYGASSREGPSHQKWPCREVHELGWVASGFIRPVFKPIHSWRRGKMTAKDFCMEMLSRLDKVDQL